MKGVVNKRAKAKGIPRLRKAKAEAEAAFKAWQEQHADSIDRSNRDRLEASLGQAAAFAAKARAMSLQALPSWADLKTIEVIYAEAARLGMEVDHVIPLRGELVCGLHVEANLRLLTKLDNLKKGNRYVLD